MFGVREDETVRLAVDDAAETWERADDAWQTVCWTLAREPTSGAALGNSGSVRAFVYEGARSIDMPSIDVIYTFDGTYVTIMDARFYDSAYHLAGRA